MVWQLSSANGESGITSDNMHAKKGSSIQSANKKIRESIKVLSYYLSHNLTLGLKTPVSVFQFRPGHQETPKPPSGDFFVWAGRRSSFSAVNRHT